MPRTSRPKSRTQADTVASSAGTVRSIPAAEALSFLQETRGVSTWTARDMAASLKIGLADAKPVISFLQLQGYVKPYGPIEFMTTLAGEEVSGSKTPRLTRERVEKTLQELRQRIAENNRHPATPYKITKAVAFGDFLRDRVRVQAAEVGIGLEPRGTRSGDAESAIEHRHHQVFLKQLVGRVGVVHVRPYEEWMGQRSHANLL